MVSFVIVSHSEKLADGVIDLVRMSAKEVMIEPAGGMEDGGYGTSFDKIKQAIQKVYTDDGVIVLMDLGSAIMTTEMAINDINLKNVIKVECPLVTGAVSGTVLASTGASIDEIEKELKTLKM